MTLAQYVPFLRWMRRYRRDDLRGDVTAGLTTAVMLVSQAMGYAMVAGLPPIAGLYASIAPLALYMLLGTSRQLAVGPVALDSLLVAAAVGGLAATGSAEYVAYAALLAAMVGVIQVAMGVLRLGFVVNLLSLPVISGFTSAAALIIAASQIEHVLGVRMPRTTQIHEIALALMPRLDGSHLPTVMVSAAAIAILVALARLAPRVPRALVVVVLGTLAVWSFGLDQRGVAVVGAVPSGLPAPALPRWDAEIVRALLPAAATIALVAFMEAISVGKAFARKGRYELDANQELVALGASNMGAALFRGFPIAGGLSRTAVNAQAGARTPLASLITAAVVAVTLLVLTPLFHHLPKAVLASIIVTAVVGLIDVAEVRRLYRTSRADLAMLLITFAATLVLGVQIGIGLGVAASLAWFVYQSNRPHVAILGRLPGTSIYRNVLRFPEAETFPGIVIMRIDAPVYFGNASFVKSTVGRILVREPVRTLILDASAICTLDASADATLHELADDLAGRGVALVIAGANGPVRDAMARFGFRDYLGADRFHHTVDEAVTARAQARDPGATDRAASAPPERAGEP